MCRFNHLSLHILNYIIQTYLSFHQLLFSCEQAYIVYICKHSESESDAHTYCIYYYYKYDL